MTLSPIDDRLSRLRSFADRFTGIAFVFVERPANEGLAGACGPFTLRVYFLTDVQHELTYPLSGLQDPSDPSHLIGLLTPEDIIIHDAHGDPLVNEVAVVSGLTFGADLTTCLSYVQFDVPGPHDFRKYRLRIDDPFTTDTTHNPSGLSRIDPYFNDVEFTFEVGCDNGLDCAPAPQPCPLEPPVDFPVDYLARDFVSLQNALLDFASHRYPEWTFPIEADVGRMLAEIFAALGDEFSYIQDRYARESFLETATERRTLRKKARLLDYDIHDGRNATTLLDVMVKVPEHPENPPLETIDLGKQVWAMTEGADPVVFETGLGLRDTHEGYPVCFGWNLGSLPPYWRDTAKKCLDIGTTEVLVGEQIPHVSVLQAAATSGDLLMLLRTDPTDASIPSRRHFVHVTSLVEEVDPLLSNPNVPNDPNALFTRITWDKGDALPFQIDQDLLELSFNIVPATAGATRRGVSFICQPSTSDSNLPVAVEREGFLPLQLDPAVAATRPTICLFSLPDTETGGLGFLGPSLRETRPEVILTDPIGLEWEYTRSLLDADSTQDAFTLEDGTWRRIVAYRHVGEEIVQSDYATGQGYTIRFGDDVFGRIPPEDTVFNVTYRLNPGVLANVASDTIINPKEPGPVPPSDVRLPGDLVETVTNPWPVLDGVDPESASNIKLFTPEAYKVDLFFAVTPDDYGVQAARLPFVQRGFGKFRWTGSWSTVFASADPFGSFTLSDQQRSELEGWLDCVRQAGRDVIVKDPRFRTLDLEITICVEPFAYAGQVARLVSEALLGRGGTRPLKGFFNPDNFTFGTPLRRSVLETVIQEVPGVRSVFGMRVRSRERFVFEDFNQLTLDVDADEVIRLENDPTHPERGSLRILTQGGA